MTSAAPEMISPMVPEEAIARAWADALADIYEALMRETGIGVELLTPRPDPMADWLLRSPGPEEYTA